VPLWIREALGADAGVAVLAIGSGGVALALALLLAAFRRRGRRWHATMVVILGVLISGLHVEWHGRSLPLEPAGLLLAGIGSFLLARDGWGRARWCAPALLVGAALVLALYQTGVAPTVTEASAPWFVLLGLLGLPLVSRGLRQAGGPGAILLKVGLVLGLLVLLCSFAGAKYMVEWSSKAALVVLLLSVLFVALETRAVRRPPAPANPGLLDSISPAAAFFLIGAVLVLQEVSQVTDDWRAKYLWGMWRMWVWLAAVLIALFLAALRPEPKTGPAGA
jgi:peptidoglycan/LPS O-acetylase OafA/YrhL